MNNDELLDLVNRKVVEYTDIFYNNEPADMESATRAVQRLYELIDRPKPEVFVHMSSPIDARVKNHYRGNDLSVNRISHEMRQLVVVSNMRNLYDADSEVHRINMWVATASLRVPFVFLPESLYFERTAARSVVIQTWLSGNLSARHIFMMDIMTNLFPHKASNKNKMALASMRVLARSAHLVYPFEEVCFICDRPSQLHLDEENELHSETAESILYPDGASAYSFHGEPLRPHWVKHPHTIGVDDLVQAPTPQIGRWLISRADLNTIADEIAENNGNNGAWRFQDDHGELFSVPMPDDELLQFVRVKNATPEPDGSVKEYCLRVPPHIDNARTAVAWTFGQPWYSYHPVAES